MTDHGMQELGEISCIKRHKDIHETVHKGEEVLSLDWDYHVIKTINEPSWTVVSGTYRLKSPVHGRVEYMIEEDEIEDEDEVLLTLSSDADSLQPAIFPLVTEQQYLNWVAEEKQRLGQDDQDGENKTLSETNRPKKSELPLDDQ